MSLPMVQTSVKSIQTSGPEQVAKVQVTVSADLWRRARSKAALLGHVNRRMVEDALRAYLEAKKA
jgi:hypothetical protein